MNAPVLAVDLGSTRLKLALIDSSGRMLDSASIASPLQSARVDANDVLGTVIDAGLRLCGVQRPAALTITGATRTHVFADAAGRPLAPVVKLDDPCGAEFEAAVQKACGLPNARHLGAFHPLARLMHLQKSQPQVFGATRWQLEIKDWLNLALCGRAACDAVTWARLTPPDVDPAAVLQRLGMRPDLCAPPMPMARTLAPVRAAPGSPWTAWDGVPVVACGFDTWCATYGMGCVQSGAAYNVTGTTEAFGGFHALPVALDGVACLPWGDALHHLGGPCLTGLGTLAWFGREFLDGADPADVLACAAQSGEDTPLCVPFIAGERMPYWDPGLSANFLQVRSHHGKPELARALVDGLMVFQRQLVTLLSDGQGDIFLGGASTLPGWAELKSGAFGRTIRRSSHPEPGLLGAAMCGLTALGHYDAMQSAQAVLAPPPLLVPPERSVTLRMQSLETRLLPHFPPLPGRVRS